MNVSSFAKYEPSPILLFLFANLSTIVKKGNPKWKTNALHVRDRLCEVFSTLSIFYIHWLRVRPAVQASTHIHVTVLLNCITIQHYQEQQQNVLKHLNTNMLCSWASVLTRSLRYTFIHRFADNKSFFPSHNTYWYPHCKCFMNWRNSSFCSLACSFARSHKKEMDTWTSLHSIVKLSGEE